MLYLAHGQKQTLTMYVNHSRLKTIGQETLSKTSLGSYQGSHHGNYNCKLLTAFLYNNSTNSITLKLNKLCTNIYVYNAPVFRIVHSICYVDKYCQQAQQRDQANA